MRKLLAVASAVLISVSTQAIAAEHWIHLSTPHFEMYTTNSEKQGAAALAVFEQVRYFFLESSKSKSAPNTTAKIIAFRSEKEYKPYRMNEGAFAYYLRSRKADYIVMQDISPEHHQAALHEYTHLIAQNLNLNLPVWLNEGLADLYSSLEPKGNKAIVGRPLEGREAALQQQHWIDLNTLFAVGPDSPYYNEKDKMSIFYAESWALTHMLSLGKSYISGFPQFLAGVAAGRPAPDCLQSAYGKDLSQVTKDLHAYLNQSSVQAAVYDIKLSTESLDPVVSEPSEFAVDLLLADLLAAQKTTQSQAEESLTKLAAEHPDSSDVQESLGYLAWEKGNRAKAQEYFKLAVDKGSKNPDTLSSYAAMLNESGASPDQLLPLLQQMVAITPDAQDAWFNLGVTATRASKYGLALDALSHIKTIKSDRAYALFSTKAFCYLQLKSFAPARDMAENARKYAKTPEESSQASNLLRQLDSLDHPNELSLSAPRPGVEEQKEPNAAPDAPVLRRKALRQLPRDQPSVHWPDNLQHVEAVAKSFDCSATSHRLRVTVDNREMTFELVDPENIVVRNAKNPYIDFQCGAQKPVNIGIFYIPSSKPGAADGVIRELVY